MNIFKKFIRHILSPFDKTHIFQHHLSIDSLIEQNGGELVNQTKRSSGAVSGQGSYGTVEAYGDRTVGKIMLTNDVLNAGIEMISDHIFDAIIRENATLSRLYGVPNIINYHNLYINVTTMDEYFENLHDTLKHKRYPRTELQLKNIFFKIIDAVNSMHRSRIYHTDLKPKNIMIGRQVDDDHVEMDDIAVIDFGLSHFGDKTIHAEINYRIGTPLYAAPETDLMLGVTNTYDFEKLDVWSLGLIGLEIFSENFELPVFYKLCINDPSYSCHYRKLYNLTQSEYTNIPKIFEDIPSKLPHNIDDYAPILKNDLDLKNLLEGMLNLSPTARYGMNEILNSTFCNGYILSNPCRTLLVQDMINTLTPPQNVDDLRKIRLYPKDISSNLIISIASEMFMYIQIMKKYKLSWKTIMYATYIFINIMKYYDDGEERVYSSIALLIASAIREPVQKLHINSMARNYLPHGKSEDNFKQLLYDRAIAICEFFNYDFYFSTPYDILMHNFDPNDPNIVGNMNIISILYFINLCWNPKIKLGLFIDYINGNRGNYIINIDEISANKPQLGMLISNVLSLFY